MKEQHPVTNLRFFFLLELGRDSLYNSQLMRRFPRMVGMPGRVQGTTGCGADYWTAIGTSDRLFCYIQTKKSSILSGE